MDSRLEFKGTVRPERDVVMSGGNAYFHHCR